MDNQTASLKRQDLCWIHMVVVNVTGVKPSKHYMGQANIYTMFLARVLCGIFILFTLTETIHGQKEWSYTKPATAPENWKQNYPMCGGIFQSPVNIEAKDAKFDPLLKPIRIYQDLQYSTLFSVFNNGHSFDVRFPKLYWRMSLRNATRGEYCLDHMQLHWGSNSSLGSEHTVNGKPYALEAQLVAFNCDAYASLEEASSAAYGLAILSFLGELQEKVDKEDTLMGRIMGLETTLYKTPLADNNIEITTSNLSKIMDLLNILTYQMFGDLESEKLMSNNFRPVQPLSSPDSPLVRVVYESAGTHPTAISLFLVSLYTLIEQLL
ncbi:unnamed protein product [Echinostoma caproni]|uniref:carbonic anhydrase n=1 Tax=Echinostoma caproni TaxID=27848 RepID=A0A183B0J2_9TREM|nr:unnamed protein product [Echinostoma caproni]